MRTTINLSDELLARAKQAALDSGKTLTAIIEEALQERLARSKDGDLPEVRITTFGGSGLQPDVDLDDSAALLDLMESPDAAS
jgi:hypothetical protein